MASKSKNGIEAANGKFRFVFRANGEKQRGPWVDTHKEAKQLMIEKQAELRNMGSANKVFGTVAELVGYYVQEQYVDPRTGTPTWGSTKSHELRRIQEDELVGRLQVKDITRNKMIAWGRALQKTLSPSTILTRICYLNHVLVTAEQLWSAEGRCTVAVCAEMASAIAVLRKAKVALPSVARKRLATREEIEQAVAAAAGSASYVDLPAVVAVLSRMPIRLGELCKITKGDLVEGQRSIWLRNRKHPDHRVHERNDELVPFIVDPLTGIDTFELVKARLAADAAEDAKPFDFASPDVSNAWAAATAKAQIEDLHLHDLRAFGITNLLNGGIDSIVVSKLSGHRDARTMGARYARQSGKAIASTIRANFKAVEELTVEAIDQMIATLQRERAALVAREAASRSQLKLAA